MHGHAGGHLVTADGHPHERDRDRADDRTFLLGEQHRRRRDRVAAVEPVELGLVGPFAPDALHQPGEVGPPGGVVLDDPHRDEVPST
jgi:hypothetical protein